MALDRATGYHQVKRIPEVNTFRHLAFDLWYLRRPPWDSGIIPPEVEEFIRFASPGRALDLGCGTGTSSLGLARAGWKVTGVDFTRRAVSIAKRKGRAASLNLEFLVGNVTQLPQSVFTHRYDLILDIGCFHGLSPSGKASYLNQLEHLLAPEGTWLLYGFFTPEESPLPNIDPVNQISFQLKLCKRQDGLEKMKRPSAWFWFQKA
jgi:cyclopropane fatty-acyl-phospholipid synthase-like methyltransferase